MPKSSPYLEVKDAGGVRKVPVTGSPITIGRNITNMLALDEPLASRFHCVIEKWKDGYRVRDLDSRNGILVNGQATKAAMLGDGDVVTLGGTELKLVLTAAGARSNAGSSPDVLELESLAADDLAASLEPVPANDAVDIPAGGGLDS